MFRPNHDASTPSRTIVRRTALSLSTLLLLSLATLSSPAHAQDDDGMAAWDTQSDEQPEQKPVDLRVRETSVASTAPMQPDEALQRGLDDDVKNTEERLRIAQKRARTYVGTWTVLQSAAISINALVAVRASRDVMRGSYALGAALSAASFLHMIEDGWPVLGSLKHFQRMPDNTPELKVKKIEYAERVMAAQANKDRMSNAIDRHIGIGVIAVGCGLGVGLGYGNLREGLSRTLSILFVGELQLLTRPNMFVAHDRNKSGFTSVALLPWAERHGSGLQLSAQF